MRRAHNILRNYSDSGMQAYDWNYSQDMPLDNPTLSEPIGEGSIGTYSGNECYFVSARACLLLKCLPRSYVPGTACNYPHPCPYYGGRLSLRRLHFLWLYPLHSFWNGLEPPSPNKHESRCLPADTGCDEVQVEVYLVH